MTKDAHAGDQAALTHGLLRTVTRLSARHPVTALLLAALVTAVATGYSAWGLKFKTDRSDLIAPEAAYHQRWLNYTRMFGDVSDIVVVVEGPDRASIQQAVQELGPLFERESKHFDNVLYRVDPTPLARKGLQYLRPEQLQDLLDRLAELSPILKGDWRLLTLKNYYQGLRHQLTQAAESDETDQRAHVEMLLAQAADLSRSLEKFAAAGEYVSPWSSLMPVDEEQARKPEIRYLFNERGTLGFVKAQPVADKSDFTGASAAIDRAREIIRDAGRRHPSVRLGLTGVPVLESDEMRASQAAMFKASALSFVGCWALVIIGFRGLRHPLLATVTLAAGMAWAFAFTTAAVGHLSILSVSFATILIGLGIDFSIYFLSHYLGLRHAGRALRPALLETSQTAGPAIVTAAVTTSLGFLCALLTDFLGVAELGLIAGGGLLLCLVATFWVLPALIVLCDRHTRPRELPTPIEGRRLTRFTASYPWVAIVGSVLLLTGLGRFVTRVKYDYNLLNLQAEGVESVEVQRRVFDQADGSLLFAVSIADSPQQALSLKRRFEALPTVQRVEEIASMLPPVPSEATSLLVQAIHAQLSGLPQQVSQLPPIDPADTGEQVDRLYRALKGWNHPAAAAIRKTLDRFLDAFEKLPLDRQIELLAGYEVRIAHDLLVRMQGLAAASDPQPVSVADLPPALAARFVCPQEGHAGKWLLQIEPREQIWDIEPLAAFISDVRSVDPEATGTPLQTYEASRQIREAYQKVALYALAAVVAVLLIDFRNLRHALLALLVPGFGGLLMFGLMGWMGVDLNPANLIVLPLVVGMGVDTGVHVLHDYRLQQGVYRTSSSTVNAITLNVLTSIIGFGSMMIAEHRGLYSLGLVLVIGLSCCLFVSLVLLPAVLSVCAQHRAVVAAMQTPVADDVAESAAAIIPHPSAAGDLAPALLPIRAGEPSGTDLSAALKPQRSQRAA